MTYDVPIILNVSKNITLKGYNPILKFKNKQEALTFISKLRSRRFEDIHSGALFAFEDAEVFPMNTIGPHIYWMDPARYPTTKVGRYVYGCYCLYENAEVMEDCDIDYNLPEGEVPNDPNAPMNIIERSEDEQMKVDEKKAEETPKPKRTYNKKETAGESAAPVTKRKYTKKPKAEELVEESVAAPVTLVEESVTAHVTKRKYTKKPKAEPAVSVAVETTSDVAEYAHA